MNHLSDRDLTANALFMWANHVETGTVTLSAEDAINSGKRDLIKPINDSQKAFVLRLRNLGREALKSGVR